MGRRLHVLSPDTGLDFPPVELASPEGLLAVGGDLRPERLLAAYRRGIFPWYNDGQPILWWSPDPRAVLFPERLKVARSLRKTLRVEKFSVTLDTYFREVMTACAQPRRTGTYKCRERHDSKDGGGRVASGTATEDAESGRHSSQTGGTWITPAMIEAYVQLHELGHAHSVEVWREKTLVGGLYGVALGGAFFGESMFAYETDASKVAFARLVPQLVRWGYTIIDCQQYTAHLARFGAEEIRRDRFLQLLTSALALPDRCGPWRFDDQDFSVVV